MKNSAYEIYEDLATGTIFYFSHSDENFTTGVMAIPPKIELPKHNRPNAFENALQISGRSIIQVFDDDGAITEHELSAGDTLRMDKGQFHIHANPFDEVSYSLFKAEGDISESMKFIRENYKQII